MLKPPEPYVEINVGSDYLAPGFIRYHPPSFMGRSFWFNNPLDSTANERLIKSKVQASRPDAFGSVLATSNI